MQIDAEVYTQLRSTGLFYDMPLSVDEVGNVQIYSYYHVGLFDT